MTFEQALIEKVRAIRERLQQYDSIGHMHFNIYVNGRVHEGELELNYSIGNSYNPGGQVTGSNLDALVEEYLRRFHFDKRNQTKLISFCPETEVQDTSTKSVNDTPF